MLYKLNCIEQQNVTRLHYDYDYIIFTQVRRNSGAVESFAEGLATVTVSPTEPAQPYRNMV